MGPWGEEEQAEAGGTRRGGFWTTSVSGGHPGSADGIQRPGTGDCR